MEQKAARDSSSSSSYATHEPNQPNHYQNLTQTETSLLVGRPQEIQLQGLLTDQAAGSTGLYPSGGTWNQIQFPTIPIQIQQGMGACSIRSALPLHQEKGLSTCNYNRMKMAWKRDIPLRSNLLLTSRPRPIKNGVYDAMYEVIGLPVDPHLRMFVARGGNGNEQH